MRNVTVESAWMDHGNGVSPYYYVQLNGKRMYDVGFWSKQDAEIYAHGLHTFDGLLEEEQETEVENDY